VPDLPVMVTVKVPVVARLPAVRVKVLADVAGLGVNDAVAPLCKPEAESVTLPLKPFKGVMVTLVVPFAPRAMLKLVGDAEREKSGVAVTVREMVVEAVKPADVPVTVKVTVPAVAVPLAVRVRVLVLLVLAGLKDAVTPLGSPEADKLTAPLKPLSGLTVMLLVFLLPCTMVSEFGEAESVKLPEGLTVSVTFVC
jgi:hypothetical protein